MWNALFAQLNRRFADKQLDEIVSRLSAAVPPLVRHRPRSTAKPSDTLTSEEDLERLLTEYSQDQILEIHSFIEGTLVSSRLVDTVFVKYAQSHPTFHRTGPDARGRYHYSSNENDPEFNYKKSYDRQMEIHRKVGFDVFSRGASVDVGGVSISVRKIRFYGWMIFNGVVEFIEARREEILSARADETKRKSIIGRVVSVDPYPEVLIKLGTRRRLDEPALVPARKRRRSTKNGHVPPRPD
jgi:hypothetical protein